jgi:hypothetical protein
MLRIMSTSLIRMKERALLSHVNSALYTESENGRHREQCSHIHTVGMALLCDISAGQAGYRKVAESSVGIYVL